MFSSSTGHDVKSLLINLWMSILFVAPVLWYFEIASIQHCMIAFGEEEKEMRDTESQTNYD